MTDPPNPDVARTLSRLNRDGVEVKILTGDNELVTRHICCQVGFQRPVIVLGAEIDAMTDPALCHVAEQANVFARVTPMQKLRILRALRQRGRVVGFIGDGINDAPALHAADVGISVASAVDVAKKAVERAKASSGEKSFSTMRTRGYLAFALARAGREAPGVRVDERGLAPWRLNASSSTRPCSCTRTTSTAD